jgi:UDP-N-acetylmuramate dehydrogenase
VDRVRAAGARIEQTRSAAGDTVEALRAACRDVRVDEPLSRHVSFRIGGPADVLVVPRSLDELRGALRVLYEGPDPFVVLGRGSNVLVSDRGVRGVVVKIGHGLDRVRWEGTRVVAEAGSGLPSLAFRAADRGLSGLEFAAGIPASAGGAAVMNAGAHGHSMEEVVKSVRAFGPGGEHVWTVGEMEFAYRTSRLQRDRAVVLQVELELRRADPHSVRSQMEAWLRHRAATQPIGPPSSGCVFRNPPGDAAGRLIDLAGVKGLASGAVCVSEVHANYLLNRGGGRAEDVVRLVKLVRERVRSRFGVELELEVKLIGEFGG